MNLSILDYFDFYTSKKWKVVPISPNYKNPFIKNWNKNHNLYRNVIKIIPNCNLGLILGNIVDVESDTKCGNSLLENLIGDCEHIKYKSLRSVHHLFINPFNDLTCENYCNIEFRGFLHQSILPPSKIDDREYYWLSGMEREISVMPKKLLNFLKRRR